TCDECLQLLTRQHIKRLVRGRNRWSFFLSWHHASLLITHSSFTQWASINASATFSPPVYATVRLGGAVPAGWRPLPPSLHTSTEVAPQSIAPPPSSRQDV